MKRALSGKDRAVGLEKSERLYRLLTENANDVIWSCDLDMTFQYVSPSVEKLLGWTADEVIEAASRGRSAGIPPPRRRESPGRPGSTRSGRRVLDSGIFEIEQNRKDGTRVWTEVSARPFLDDEGGWRGIRRDPGYFGAEKKEESPAPGQKGMGAHPRQRTRSDRYPGRFAPDRAGNRAMAERLGLTPASVSGGSVTKVFMAQTNPSPPAPHTP